MTRHPMDPPAPVDPLATRRRFLQLGGASVLGLVLAACSDGSGGGSSATDGTASSASAAAGDSETAASAGSTAVELPALTAADFDAIGTCLLLPEKTAGPFPLDEQFVRRDVTEGVEGHPVRLGLRVVDEACTPVPGAAVEIWHADATGDYSAFADGGGGKDEAAGTTFLRGTQVADEDGIVEFLTIFPGWYPGRAVHVHLRVHEATPGSARAIDETLVLTSQLFFDEAYVATVHADAPYARFGLPDTTNAEDAIAGDPAREGTLATTVAAPTGRGQGTLALLNLGIDPSAGSTGGASGGRGA